MTWALGIAVLSLLAWIVVYALSLHGRDLGAPLEPRAPTSGRAPRVHVFVPARNEERDVGDTLRSLLAQDYPNLRILLVDDGSTDRTRDIAESLAQTDGRLEVLDAGELPDGWIGKPHALHKAWRHAAPEPDDLLLFTDADITFGPVAISRAVSELTHRDADVLTLLPSLDTVGFWERLLQPTMANLIGLWAVAGTLGRRRERQTVIGAGAFLMFRARAYRKAGGHRAVRDQIVEDVALTTNAHRRGLRVESAFAPQLLRVRMYHGIGEIWRGWAKNLFAGHGDRIVWALCTVGGLLLLSVIPPAMAPPAWRFGEPIAAGLFGGAFLLGVVYRAEANRRMRQPLWPAFLHPLAALVVAGILLQSLWQRRFGAGAEWRGRRYPMG